MAYFHYHPASKPDFLALNIHDLLRIDNLSILFAFVLVGFFDATGTLLGVLRQPLFKNDPQRPKNCLAH